MKYNININQKELSKYKELDLIDCAILDYLYVIGNSKNANIQAMRIGAFTWVDYKTLLNDNPLLRIKSSNSITPRIKKIEKAGFIKTKVVRKNGRKMFYFELTELVDSLYILKENSIQTPNRTDDLGSKNPNRTDENPNRETENPNRTDDYIISTNNKGINDSLKSTKSKDFATGQEKEINLEKLSKEDLINLLKEKKEKKPTPAKKKKELSHLELKNGWQEVWNERLEWLKVQYGFKFKAEKSEKIAFKQLYELSGGDKQKAKEIILQSSVNGWRRLVEIKKYNGQKYGNTRKDLRDKPENKRRNLR